MFFFLLHFIDDFWIHTKLISLKQTLIQAIF